MKKPKAVKSIPSTMDVVDSKTGKLVERKGMSWGVLQPAKDKCQICAVKHEPHEPHNAQSLYYQMAFESMNGRAATWADAMAHCSIEMKAAWEKILTECGHWTEPPTGEDPIEHHGVE